MKIKKTIYIFLAGMLGFLLHILAHVCIEVLYLRSLTARGIAPDWYTFIDGNLEALPFWFVILLAIVGTGFGIYLGFVWWKIVYVEKRHWRCKEKINE